MSAAATETAQKLWRVLAHARGVNPCGRSGTGTAFPALQHWVPVALSAVCYVLSQRATAQRSGKVT